MNAQVWSLYAKKHMSSNRNQSAFTTIESQNYIKMDQQPPNMNSVSTTSQNLLSLLTILTDSVGCILPGHQKCIKNNQLRYAFQNNIQSFYLLKNISPFIIVHHSKKQFVAESRWVTPGISQDLILFISLPGTDNGQNKNIFEYAVNRAINRMSNSGAELTNYWMDYRLINPCTNCKLNCCTT